MGNQNRKTKDIDVLVACYNISSSKSQISEVDFAVESASFTKKNILSKSGSYYKSQANLAHQKVCRLLQ